MPSAAQRWRCPECGREFGRRNQFHTCAEARSIEGWLAELRPADRSTAEAVLALLQKLGPVLVEAVQIGLLVKRTRSFAELRTRRTGLRLTFLLSRDLDSPRIARTQRLSANRWAHDVDLASDDELDGEVRAWLAEAYESSPS